MKNKSQNHSAATPQGGAAAHSDIVLPIVPRQVSRKAGAKAAAQTSEPSKEPASQQECQLVGISCTSPMGLLSRLRRGKESMETLQSVLSNSRLGLRRIEDGYSCRVTFR